VSPDRQQHLDLSLFNLPVTNCGHNAEVELSQKSEMRDQRKALFWGTLARRIDLSGKASFIKKRPYGLYLTDTYDLKSEYYEALYSALETRAQQSGQLSQAENVPLSMSKLTKEKMQEVVPQFFLRNINRPERDDQVNRPSFQFAVWRQEEDLAYTVLKEHRRPKAERIEDLASFKVKRMAREIWDNVHGLSWGDDISKTEQYRAIKQHTVSDNSLPRIPIEELSMKPTPPNRGRRKKPSFSIKDLNRLYDGSK
jgi:hypothetical protein